MKPTKTADRLHQLFEVAILVKAVDGVLETIGGVLLLFVPLQSINAVLATLLAHELSGEPHDWLVRIIQHAADSVSLGSKHFASAYLLSHGVLKVFLAFALWREKLWAFPIALIFFAIFIGYQSYRFTHTHSPALIVFTLIDLAVAWLVWREYGARRLLVGPNSFGRGG